MTYYKIIAGNGRVYTTQDNVESVLGFGDKWIRITTVEGKVVYINLRHIAAIEASETFVREPSETEQAINATLDRIFGAQTKEIDTGERVRLDD